MFRSEPHRASRSDRRHRTRFVHTSTNTASAWARARRLYDDQRVRFLLVGGFNTFFGYAVFAGLYLLFGAHIGYLACLYMQYALCVPLAFFLHRRITFRVRGHDHLALDFMRFCGVYVIALVFNTVALPVLVESLRMSPLLAQAMVVTVSTIATYFGHKLFSFRRSVARGPA
jgi:putative flippase GtrA